MQYHVMLDHVIFVQDCIVHRTHDSFDIYILESFVYEGSGLRSCPDIPVIQNSSIQGYVEANIPCMIFTAENVFEGSQLFWAV